MEQPTQHLQGNSAVIQQKEIDELAFRACELLQTRGRILVAAESCTAGLIAASLGRVPGVSQVLAGSLVVYQSASKTTWLDVASQVIAEHDAVSSQVAALMAIGALSKTPHADIAVGITGHLGPESPEGLDGIAWLGYAERNREPETVRLELRPSRNASWTSLSPEQRLFIRHERQKDAVLQSLRFLSRRLAQMSPVGLTPL